MRLFKKREDRKRQDWPANNFSDNMKSFIIRGQKNWAEWMNSHTGKLNHNQWLMILALFVLLSGGYSGYLIWKSISSKGGMVFSITSMDRPIAIVDPSSLKNKRALVGSEKERQKIKRFSPYRDSIKETAIRKVEYNQITRQRSGLMDSLDAIGTYYQSRK